jgi:hypothetical protein
MSLSKKANFDLAGLPLDDIYTESKEVLEMTKDEKLKYFNSLYLK